MSSPIVIPFNFQPVETSVKTANYTIPVGRYARIAHVSSNLNSTANNANLTLATGSISLNGSVIVRAPVTYTLAGFGTTTTRTITAPSFGLFTFLFNTSSGGTFIDSVAAIAGSSYTLGGSSYTVSPAQAVSFLVKGIWTPNAPTNIETWLRAGDVITIASMQVRVEEFNQIS